MSKTHKNIKIYFGKEIHLTKAEVNFEELIQFIKQSFKKQPENIALSYKDSDGDNVTISCDEDIKAMLETSTTMPKIYINSSEQGLSHESSESYQQILNKNDISLLSSVISLQQQSQTQQPQEKQLQQVQQPQQQQKNQLKEFQVYKVEPKKEEVEVKKPEIFTQICPTCTFINEGNFMFCKVCSEPLPQVEKKEEKKAEEKPKIEKKRKSPKQQQLPQFFQKLRDVAQQVKEQKKQEKQEEVEKTSSPQEEKKQIHNKVPLIFEKIKERAQEIKAARKSKKSGLSQQDKNIRKLVREEFRKTLPDIISSVKLQVSDIQQNLQEEKQPSSENKQEKDIKIVHKHIICDGCNQTYITGIRYKCAICEDFDFCEKCEATKEHNHPFLKIRKPELAPKFIMCGLNEDDMKQKNIFNRGFFKKPQCPFKQRRCSPKKEQQQQEQEKKDPVSHIFEDLKINDIQSATESISKVFNMFMKPQEEQQKKEQTQEQQTQQQQSQEQQEAPKTRADQVAEILGGKPQEFEDVLAVYPEKDVNEIVRIILAEREAIKKYQPVQKKDNTVVITEETPKEVKLPEVQKVEKKYKKNFSSNTQKRAKEIAEILGGEFEEYLGVCDNFLFSPIEQIIDMVLDDCSLLEKYSSFA